MLEHALGMNRENNLLKQRRRLWEQTQVAKLFGERTEHHLPHHRNRLPREMFTYTKKQRCWQPSFLYCTALSQQEIITDACIKSGWPNDAIRRQTVKHLSILVKRQAIPWINADLLWIGLTRTMQVKFVSAHNLHKNFYLQISCANYGQ